MISRSVDPRELQKDNRIDVMMRTISQVATMKMTHCCIVIGGSTGELGSLYMTCETTITLVGTYKIFLLNQTELWLRFQKSMTLKNQRLSKLSPSRKKQSMQLKSNRRSLQTNRTRLTMMNNVDIPETTRQNGTLKLLSEA